MKPLLLESPRLICRLARQWQAIAGRPPAQSGHAANCQDCQAYFQRCATWETTLHRDALQSRPTLPEGFEQRILAAVRESGEHPRSVRARPERVALAGFGLVAAAIAVGFFLRTPQPSKTTPDGTANPADLVALLGTAKSASTQLWRSLEPSAVELASKNPLQHEIDSVYADAQSAVGFLALNFLPSVAQHSAPNPPAAGAPQRG